MTLKQAVHALLMLEGAGIQASISHHGAAKRDYNVEMVDCKALSISPKPCMRSGRSRPSARSLHSGNWTKVSH